MASIEKTFTYCRYQYIMASIEKSSMSCEYQSVGERAKDLLGYVIKDDVITSVVEQVYVNVHILLSIT